MAKPSIRVTLEDGTGTNVTVAYIDHPSPDAAMAAADQAFAWFISTIERDRASIEARLNVAFESE